MLAISENKKKNVYFLGISFFFLYFLTKLIFFSIFTPHYIPPDEITHFGKSLIYKELGAFVQDSEETYRYGLITHVPKLYHLSMGFILRLNVFGAPDLIFLRFFNILFGMLFIWYSYKWFKLITKNRLAHFLFVITLTNTLMLTFLNATVNHDNLINLFVAMSSYYLFAFFQERNPNKLLLFHLFLFLGCLTKVTMVPIALLLYLVLIYHERKRLRSFIGAFSSFFFKGFQVYKATALMTIFLLAGLNLNLYLNNLVHYKRIIPRGYQILTEEQQMQNRNLARNLISSSYIKGKLSYEEAIEEVKKIWHEGDRRGAISLIENYKKAEEENRPYLNRFQYTLVWIQLMLQRTFGLFGHQSVSKKGLPLMPYFFIFLLFLFTVLLYLKKIWAVPFLKFSLIIAAVYCLALMQFLNYPMYLKTHFFGLALHGRYLFPILPFIYGLFSVLICEYLPKKIQFPLAALIAIVFLSGEFPFFLQRLVIPYLFGG